MTFSLQPTGGLRVDPFDTLPVENSKYVIDVADYCTSTCLSSSPCTLIMCSVIHVWAIRKATN